MSDDSISAEDVVRRDVLAGYSLQPRRAKSLLNTIDLLRADKVKAYEMIDAARELVEGLRDTLAITQTVLRRYMACVDLNTCLCDQCDEEPSRPICCASCIYCQARYALGEIDLEVPADHD